MKTHGTLRYRPGVRPGRGQFLLTASPHVMQRAKRLLPRAAPGQGGVLLVSDTSEAARDLQWITERYPVDAEDAAAEALSRLADAHRDTEERVVRILQGERLHLDLREAACERREYQLLAAEMVLQTGRLLLVDDVGLGKAQPLDAPVLTPDGFKRMGEVRVGDEVISGDGTATPVIAVHPRDDQDCYRVTFSDGSTTECSPDHLWRVSHRRRCRSKVNQQLLPMFWQTLPLREIIAQGVRRRPRKGQAVGQANWHVPMVEPVRFSGSGSLPLDPYLLGVLLGDGGFTGAGVRMTSADDLAEIEAVLPPYVSLAERATYSYSLVDKSPPKVCLTEGCNRVSIARGLCSRCYQRGVKQSNLPPVIGRRHAVIDPLRRLGLWGHGSLTKFVPEAYKVASVDDRLALLQGLMDTDGCALRGRGNSSSAQFYSSSPQLARDVRWLAESLGGLGRITSKMAAGRERFAVTVKLPVGMNPFRLARKARMSGRGLPPTRAIVAVDKIGRKPMQCISVAHPEQTYVTDRFVVTHNSISGLLALRDPRALPAVVVCLTHLPRQWSREVAKALPWLLVHTVTTLEPYDPARRRGVGRRPDVLIVPWSKLRGWGAAVAGEAATVIFDEAQELRTGASQKYWAAEKAASQADYLIGLTATPVYNYGGEIWNILNIIAPDVLGSYPEFTREWCGEPVNDGDPERRRPRATRADGTDSTRTASNKVRVADPAALSLYLRDAGVMLRRTRKDVGRELPPVVTVPHIVDADADMLDRMNEEVVMLADAILRKETERSTRWRASGELDWKLRRATGLAKAPYVADFVRTLLETEERVVLFGWHRDVYEQWQLRLADLKPVFYTGTESPTQKARSVDAFTEGNARVLIVSLRAGAGLDGLQDVCHVAVFGELDWSPGVHLQCVGRLWRDGQAEPVVAYFLYTEDGSDPVILDVLNVKRMQSEPLLDPTVEPLAQASGTEERVRRLAGEVIRRHRERKRR